MQTITEGSNVYVVDEGEKYRVPYNMVKEVVFRNLKKDELIDLEHSARLQYRLLLNDAILKAKVEFVKQIITITYNPKDSGSKNAEISLGEIVQMLEKEGVHVDLSLAQQRDVDYKQEIWYAQFHSATIREHPPYSFTMDEWKKMKPEYEKNVAKSRKKKWEKFTKWQKDYEKLHPELLQK
ncbi:MAG: hypothetical protein QW091_00200 [Candidatus Micrarchaeaceae archaeon]